MGDDPLAQYRKTPPAQTSAGTPKGPEEYVAFAGKDKPLYLEIRRAMALASLREGWRLAEAAGGMSDEEIDLEISLSRAERQARKAE